MVMIYLFFEDFLLDFLEAFFFAATSAHHLSCRTGPPGRAYLAKGAGPQSGKLGRKFRVAVE